MTLVRDRLVSLSSSGLMKMDERKRPAAHDHEDSGLPSKKQVMSVNGAGKAHIDAEMPWRDDLEVSFSDQPDCQGAKPFYPSSTLKVSHLVAAHAYNPLCL